MTENPALMALTPVVISTAVTDVMGRLALSACHGSISMCLSLTYLTSSRGWSRSSPQTFPLRISGHLIETPLPPRTFWGCFLPVKSGVVLCNSQHSFLLSHRSLVPDPVSPEDSNCRNHRSSLSGSMGLPRAQELGVTMRMVFAVSP